VKDPQTYLVSRGIKLSSFFDVSRPAKIDSLHQQRVNWEYYFFADEAERARFAKAPVQHCGLVTDPVSRKRFQPKSKSPQAQHEGTPFYFESEANLKLFAATPDSFEVPPKRRMSPPPAAK